MTENVCDKIPQEKLVAFADGQLSPNESAEVSEHITQCETCAAMVDALQRSIELVTASWAAEQANWPKWRSPDKPGLKRWPMRRMATVAASILLVLGLGLIWRMLSEPAKPIPTDRTVAHLRQTVMRAGHAAQMLAAADLLAKQPESRNYALERYKEIAADYCDTKYGAEAKLRLESP
jgi:anti-sigma factor RsiW